MSEQWLTFRATVELVRKRLGASVGRSEAVTNAALASREVRYQNHPPGPVLLMADDGLVGMNMRPGSQDKAGVTADGKPIVHKTTSAEVVRQISEEDLLDWLDRHHPRPTKARGGRPPAYNWTAIESAAIELMDENGDFSVDDPTWNAQARLEAALNDKFGVEKSALRARLPNILKDWRKAKAGN